MACYSSDTSPNVCAFSAPVTSCVPVSRPFHCSGTHTPKYPLSCQSVHFRPQGTTSTHLGPYILSFFSLSGSGSFLLLFVLICLIYNIILVSDIQHSDLIYITKCSPQFKGSYHLLPYQNVTILLVIFSMLYFHSYN